MINHKIVIPKQISLLLLTALILNFVRVFIFRNFSYTYMFWNIFLAFVPFVISSTLLLYKKEGNLSRTLLIIGGIIWLLFLPNTFYLITDLLHIGTGRYFLALFDVFMLFSSALAGLVLGIYSLFHIEQIIKIKYHKYTPYIMFVIMFLSSIGIYLGRFLRFNSWDVVSKPIVFIKSIWSVFSHPIVNVEAYIYIILFLFFIYMSYNAWKGTNMETGVS